MTDARLPAPPTDYNQSWAARLVNTLELSLKDLQTSASSQSYNVSSVTDLRTYDAAAATLDEISNTLGTLINDLKNKGIIS